MVCANCDFALRKHATDHVNDGLGGFTVGVVSAMKDGDLRSTFFTLPLAVSGKRSQSSRNDDNDEPAAKLRKEVAQLKTLVGRLQRGPSKGDGKGSRQTKSSSSDQSNKQQAPGSAGYSAPQELLRFKETEQLKFKSEGPNPKPLCTFFQRNACPRGNCRFVHVCWRCPKPGHGIVDCTAPAKKK